jgi:hypothetical protein
MLSNLRIMFMLDSPRSVFNDLHLLAIPDIFRTG